MPEERFCHQGVPADFILKVLGYLVNLRFVPGGHIKQEQGPFVIFTGLEFDFRDLFKIDDYL